MEKRLDQDRSAGDKQGEVRHFRAHVATLLLLTGLFFLNFLSRIVLAPLLLTVEEDLNLTHGEAGGLFLAISLGCCAGLVGSGFVSSRLTHRKTIILSSLTLGLALLAVITCRSLWGIRLGLGFLGVAAGVYLPSAIATLTSLVRSNDWGKALAIHELAPPLALITAPLLAEFLLGWRSWRGVLGLSGMGSIFAAMAFMRFGKGGAFPGVAPSPGTIRTLLSEPSLWIMMVLFSIGIGASLGIYTMLPLFLVAEHGVDRGWANTMVALSRVSGLFMVFVAGWITDRMGPARALGLILPAAGGMTIIMGLTPASWIILPVFVQPMMSASFFPAGFAALAKIAGPGTVNVAVSLTVPVGTLLGAGAIPAGIGLLGELGSFALGISVSGGVILVSAILVRYLRFSE
jgi:NNP family nitrate/nitrite transporter-like MFS transporter